MAICTFGRVLRQTVKLNLLVLQGNSPGLRGHGGRELRQSWQRIMAKHSSGRLENAFSYTMYGGQAWAPARPVAMRRAGTLYDVQLVQIGEISRAIGAFDQPDGLNAQDPRPNEGLGTGRTKLRTAEQEACLGPC